MTSTATTNTSADPAMPVDVSIVLPCFNEDRTIPIELRRIIEAFERTSLRFEVIVVDDGSTDSTVDTLSAWSDHPAVVVLHHPQRRGAGAARRTGCQRARGRVTVWTDCDLSYPNELLPALAAMVMNDPQLVQVIGARTREAGTMAPLRAVIKRLICVHVGLRLRQRIPDINSAMRAYSTTQAAFALDLIPDGFSCTSTLTVALVKQGLQTRWISVPYARRVGRSKFGPVKDTWRLIWQVERVLHDAANFQRRYGQRVAVRATTDPSEPSEALDLSVPEMVTRSGLE